MATKANPITTLPHNVISAYFDNKKARSKFTFRICPEGRFYVVGGELVPENDIVKMFPLELRHCPENPDKTRII